MGEKPHQGHVRCAHCGAHIPAEEAVRYRHALLYGDHYHCRECDPEGVWDCMSEDLDGDLH